MISFCSYSFCNGKDILNPLPTNINNMKTFKMENSIFDHFNITRDTTKEFNTNLPMWDINTILDCNFENGIGAGNVDFTLSQLTSIRLKRRRKSDVVTFQLFEWTTIKEIPIYDIADLNTILRDYFVPSFQEFEYAVVPVLNGVEGDYIIGTISTEFNGVFISDITNTFKLNANVGYGNRTSVQEVGQITPLGRRYPVVIKNGEANYEIGSVSGLLLGKDYEKTHQINRLEVTKQINEFTNFLKNGKPKMIKDLVA